jgi:hypothetical protein
MVKFRDEVPAAFLAATLRGGIIDAHCCFSRRANGSTIGRSSLIALGINDLRRSDPSDAIKP